MDELSTTNQDLALASLSNARIALASCRTAMEAKKITDAMEAARVYLERTKASAEAVNEATEIRILAERQMGEFLQTMPKAQGVKMDGKDINGDSVVIHLPSRERLEDLDITKNQSARAQKLAEIPAEEVQLRIDSVKESGEKLSTAKVLAEPRKVAKAVTPLPGIRDEIYDAAKAVASEKSEAKTKEAILKVLSRHFPHHVGALSDKPATVEDIYKAYPRHKHPLAAYKAIEKAIKDHKLNADAILEITVKYAGAVAQWSERDREYIPYPASWFNAGGFLEDPKEWDRAPKTAPKKERDYSKF